MSAADATFANQPKRACVLGWPISHSRSPLIHGHWLQEHKLEGSYERVGVPPDQFAAFLRSIPEQGGYVGANVTIPHKEAAFELVDEADETARALKACNTLWVEDGILFGSNTDAYGFLANLDAEEPGWDQDVQVAVVLGAGGAARSIVYGLQARGIENTLVVNRTLERAEALVGDLGGQAVAWDDLSSILTSADLIVNTTSLGMSGQPPLEIDLAIAPDRTLVTDAVYVPLQTPLLAAAHARGQRTVDGLGMLLHQAVPGFERWFGVRPTVTPALRQVIVDDLTKAAHG